MEHILNSLQDRKKPANRLTKNSKLFKSIISGIQDKKGSNIVVLDLRKIEEAVADFFILCDGTSNTQIKAIADNVEDKIAKECDEKPFHVERGDKWTLVDYVNIVVHVFQHDQREFYSLESLWADAERTEY